jgi:hypothetical protein
MRNQPAARFGALFLALGLSACAGGQANNALPANGSSALASTPVAMHHPNGATTLAITLPPIQPKNVAIDWSSHPNALSSATRSVAVTIAKKTFGPIALSSAQASCQTSTAGRVCTVTIDAAARNNASISVATYAKKAGAADELAAGTMTVSIFKGQTNLAKPSMYGIVRSYAVKPQQSTLTQGFAAGDPLTIYGVDAAGTAIPGSMLVSADGKFIKKFNLKFSGPTVQPSHLHLCCGIAATFVYDGVQNGTETITASAKGDASATGSGTVTILPGTTVSAQLLTRGTSTIPGTSGVLSFIEEFPLTADGNVAPTRTFLPPWPYNFFGEDANGDVWAGSTRVTNRGAPIGTVDLAVGERPIAADSKGHLYSYTSSYPNCTIVEYPARAYGSLKPVRQIDIPSCDSIGSVAVDRTGNVFVSPSSPAILEFPPTGSGSLTPTRTIALPASAGELDVDAAGNVYALVYAPNNPTPPLEEFAPGATTGTHILSGVALQNFAVDDAGDIYACVLAGQQCSLEYFPAGSNTPSRTISGSNTLLVGDPIVVPRSQ